MKLFKWHCEIVVIKWHYEPYCERYSHISCYKLYCMRYSYYLVSWMNLKITFKQHFVTPTNFFLFFSSGFSHHRGSPELWTLFFNFVLSSTSSSFKPTLSISLLHECFHLVFCLPPRLFPASGASNILLSTWPSSLRRSYLSLVPHPLTIIKKSIILLKLAYNAVCLWKM